MIYFEELKKKAQGVYFPAKQVLSVSGSPRKGGNTDSIVKQIMLGVNSENIQGCNVNLSNLDFSGCVGCERCRKDKVCTNIIDGMSVLYPDIIDSKGLIVASPVHNYNITLWMKAFIDRLYCFYDFDNNTRPRDWSSRLAGQNRKVVISAVCEQESIDDLGLAIDAMEKPMSALGFDIVGVLPVFLAFEKGAVKKQNGIMDKAFELGAKLGREL